MHSVSNRIATLYFVYFDRYYTNCVNCIPFHIAWMRLSHRRRRRLCCLFSCLFFYFLAKVPFRLPSFLSHRSVAFCGICTKIHFLFVHGHCGVFIWNSSRCKSLNGGLFIRTFQMLFKQKGRIKLKHLTFGWRYLQNSAWKRMFKPNFLSIIEIPYYIYNFIGTFGSNQFTLSSLFFYRHHHYKSILNEDEHHYAMHVYIYRINFDFVYVSHITLRMKI